MFQWSTWSLEPSQLCSQAFLTDSLVFAFFPNQVQIGGCIKLSHCVGHDTIAADALKLVVAALMTHRTNPQVQDWASQALAALCALDFFNTKCLLKVVCHPCLPFSLFLQLLCSCSMCFMNWLLS